MSKLLNKPLLMLLFGPKQPLVRGRKELISSLSVAGCIIVLRSVGLLQSLEWATLDQLFQLRPPEPLGERITIVTVDEVSLKKIGTWPIPDGKIALLLTKLHKQHPRAIGLDIYRDLKVEPGHADLMAAFKSLDNLVGIEKLSQNEDKQVRPPLSLNRKQVGFNNLVLDSDGKVRRNLLYLHVKKQPYESFGLKLAQLYLKQEGILPQRAASNPEYLQMGKAVFRRFKSDDGSYIGADDKGTQILANFPKPICGSCQGESWGFRKVSLRDVLADKVSENWIRDRIVLIGSTAASLQDFVQTPYSTQFMGTAKPTAGVELQAYFISELIAAALNGRPLIKIWSDPIEWAWILLCAYLGAMTRWRIQNATNSFLVILVLCCLLSGSAFIIFLDGWWIPIVPGLISLCACALTITFQITHMQEELKRSKEFLHQVINTIPDPVFVKNSQHQWIVLNDAYCQFIGYPKNELLGRLSDDFFPKLQADAFRACEEQVLHSLESSENEEEFTDARGNTYLIATKRSLHKDAAGNYYLVGVIRDITKRKQIEDELKRSNEEFKEQEHSLRYLAYHDPLTGLPNRKLFTEQLQESLEWGKTHNMMVGLLFIDLDGFKHVNDTLGHEVGDRLLVTIAGRLNNCLRLSDTVARLGGDEFTIILRAIPKVDVAAKVAQKILVTITEPMVFDGHVTRVSASIGISIYPLNSYDTETLIKQADAAMYRAKHLGKNRYEFS
jgi:diguanylate cyclase (GGDEF)-like protein/PAS domain S-box-containing protein